jgi:homoserine O-acetyltransferase
MDSHHLGRGRGGRPEKVLQKFKQKTLIIGITTDILCPLHEQEFLAEYIPNSKLLKIDSPYGHDGFITEAPKISKALREWL